MNEPIKRKKKHIGFAKRLLAYNIDITVLMVPFILVSFFIESNAVLFGVCFFLVCLYHAGMESSQLQGTLGKTYNKIMVVDDDGARISFSVAFARILLKFLGLAILFGGFVPIYFRKDRKGMHDIILNTCVIGKP